MTYSAVGLALGLHMDLLDYLVILTIANIVVAVPLTQASIGPYEFFTAHTAHLLAISSADAAAFAILVHALVVAPLLIGGVVATWMIGLRVGDVFYVRSRPGAPATAHR